MTVNQIKFEALRNAIYNAARKRFLNRLNRLFSFIIVIAGASAMSDLGKIWGIDNATVYAVAVATLAATAQLVFDFGGLGNVHDNLQRRYYELLAEVIDNPSEDDASNWESQLTRIYADEPAPMRALDAIARNAAVEALGIKKQRVRVTPWQTLWSQICPFNDAEFPYVDAREETALPSA